MYEVAKIEGATAYESFWKITFPMVSPLILTNMIYTIIDSFADSTVTRTIYETAFKTQNFGLSAAMAWLYTIVISFADYYGDHRLKENLLSKLMAKRFLTVQEKGGPYGIDSGSLGRNGSGTNEPVQEQGAPILWGVPLPADHRYYIHHYLSDHLQVLCGV